MRGAEVEVMAAVIVYRPKDLETPEPLETLEAIFRSGESIALAFEPGLIAAGSEQSVRAAIGS